MEPTDRAPADSTPPDGQPPLTPSTPAGPPPAAEPALVEPAPAGPALVGSAPADRPDGPVPPAAAGGPARPGGQGGRAVASGGAASAAAGARSERSPKDMAISLLVLLVPIALLIAFYRGFLGGEQPTVVDPAPALDQARSANAFPVAEPTGLGADWRLVRARFQQTDGGSSLRLGYLTPEGRGTQLVQSDIPPERLLPSELTEDSQPQGALDLDGRSWQRYTARGDERALVLLEPDRTVIVVGDASEQELRDLADAVR